MIDEHTEIEAKLDAGTVKPEAFVRWVFSNYPNILKYYVVKSPDRYYTLGEAVVRQRGKEDDPAHELTVKKRRSTDSTRDRLEIDLKFGQQTSAQDVQAFLDAVGFKLALRLNKTAHIFWVRLTSNVTASVVWYQVEEPVNEKVKTFIEVEISKGTDVTVETAKRHVSNEVADLMKEFGLNAPLNQSLWEIFSPLRYDR